MAPQQPSVTLRHPHTVGMTSLTSTSQQKLVEHGVEYDKADDATSFDIDIERASSHNRGCCCFTDGGLEALKQMARFAGPGFLVAMAYIDPGNLAADIDQGVAAGYTLAWVTLWCSILGFLIQMLSVKLGLTTHFNLAQQCRQRYRPIPRYCLWIAIEIGILAVDVLETISGAVAIRTLSSNAVPLWAGVLLTIAAGFGTLCLERWGMRVLEAAVVSMVLVMSGTFGYMFFTVGVDYGQAAKGLFVPTLNSEVLPYAVGAVGAIIMPHNLFLHSALAILRMSSVGATNVKMAMKYTAIETSIALMFALFINICIIGVFAAAFAGQGVGSVGLANAGAELAAAYGPELRYIWGAGLLAAAAASTVTSTYAGQVVVAGFLNLEVSVWYRVAIVRLATLGPTLAVAFLVTSDEAIAELSTWLNITQSIVLPVTVIPLLVFTSMKAVMSSTYVMKRWMTVVSACVILVLIAMNGYLAVSFALDKLPHKAYAMVPFGIIATVYVAFLAYLAVAPSKYPPNKSLMMAAITSSVDGDAEEEEDFNDAEDDDDNESNEASTSGGSTKSSSVGFLKKVSNRIRQGIPLDRAMDIMEGF